MIGIIYSTADTAGTNISKHIIEEYGFEEVLENSRIYHSKDNISIYNTENSMIDASFADELSLELIYFISRHRSSAGVSAFTTHSTGNWCDKDEFGCKAHSLSVSAPVSMLDILKKISEIEIKGIEKTYEATHHGPLLNTPSLFVELGGNEDTMKNQKLASLLGDAVYRSVTSKEKTDYQKVVIGVCGRHYPDKFSRLAIGKGYAFSHIMPKYALTNEDGSGNIKMLEQAKSRSNADVESAIIEWKGLNTQERQQVIGELNEIGLDYERI